VACLELPPSTKSSQYDTVQMWGSCLTEAGKKT
jgi:hypothetical protein